MYNAHIAAMCKRTIKRCRVGQSVETPLYTLKSLLEIHYTICKSWEAQRITHVGKCRQHKKEVSKDDRKSQLVLRRSKKSCRSRSVFRHRWGMQLHDLWWRITVYAVKHGSRWRPFLYRPHLRLCTGRYIEPQLSKFVRPNLIVCICALQNRFWKFALEVHMWCQKKFPRTTTPRLVVKKDSYTLCHTGTTHVRTKAESLLSSSLIGSKLYFFHPTTSNQLFGELLRGSYHYLFLPYSVVD